MTDWFFIHYPTYKNVRSNPAKMPEQILRRLDPNNKTAAIAGNTWIVLPDCSNLQKDFLEVVMQTETITYLKEHANTLELHEELLITKNGKPAFVVQSYDDYTFSQETLALLKILKLSEKSLQSAALSLEQAFA